MLAFLQKSNQTNNNKSGGKLMEKSAILPNDEKISTCSSEKVHYEKCSNCGTILNLHEGVQDQEGNWLCEMCGPE